MAFSERVKTVRREHLAMTQRELARELGVSEVIVSRWERGKSEPSLRYIRAMAVLAKLPVPWFFEDSEVAA